MLKKIKDISIVVFFAGLLIAALNQGSGMMAWNGTSFKSVEMDSVTRATTGITYPHHEIHEGNNFHAYRVVALDDAATDEIWIDTPNTTKWAHIVIRVQGNFDTEYSIYEATTKTIGTAMVEHNHERNSGTAAGVIITHTPGGAGNGTEIHHERFGNDAGPAGQGGGAGLNRGIIEWVLKQDEEYLIVVTSHTDANNVSVVIDWYEHTSKTP